MQIDETLVIVGLRKPRVELQSGLQLAEATRRIPLLSVRLPKEKVNSRVARVLLQQPPENVPGGLRLTCPNESRTPGEEEPWIIRRVFEKRTQNLSSFGKVVGCKIAESEQLANEGIIGSGGKPTFQGQNSVGIKLGTVGGKTPVAVEPGKIGLPGRGLLEEFRSFREVGCFGPHDAQIVVGTGQNLSSKRAILLSGFGFDDLLCCGLLLEGGVFVHAALHHRFGGFQLVVGAGFEQASDAVGSVAIAVCCAGGLVENVLHVVTEICFARAL